MRVSQCPIAYLLHEVSWVEPGANEVRGFSLLCCQLFSQRIAAVWSQEKKPTESCCYHPSAKICVLTYVPSSSSGVAVKEIWFLSFPAEAAEDPHNITMNRWRDIITPLTAEDPRLRECGSCTGWAGDHRAAADWAAYSSWLLREPGLLVGGNDPYKTFGPRGPCVGLFLWAQRRSDSTVLYSANKVFMWMLGKSESLFLNSDVPRARHPLSCINCVEYLIWK